MLNHRRQTHGALTEFGLIDMDIDSSSWLTALGDAGTKRDAALARLHKMLLRVAFHETYRRGPGFRIGGPELDDLAHQAANDAMVSLLEKLNTFRGESRFTTWAYRFVSLEVSNKLGRHLWRRPSVSLDAEDWEQLPEMFAADPLAQTQQRELITAVQRAMNETLTDHQRHFFVAIVIDGVPMDAMVSRSGSNRGAIYKTVFDARRKIRAYLIVNGYLEGEPTTAQPIEQAKVEAHVQVA
ncbi:sigma-70 family RNA polymerase sigma factor [Arthrobacter sp. ISL-28]|uniref:sigma-70 family RNA polymerase sigma factor n=1 Tax=Arthrobacter sp. ISL-28 TaxID=2819108 RepID=UPI001C1B85BA|nr:sigma-70 family RNA polymerase sigma factor [Arthrobacter sp. ISL-28]MBT2521379.1 sigma-70 family RNA polymerase sigma factor [Arthrobacter sp. ISL-28]